MLRCVPVGAVKGNRRRQAQAQEPAACGGFWGTGPRGNGGRSPKRDSQGMNPLSGCGQGPPFSPRDGRGNRELQKGRNADFYLRGKAVAGLAHIPAPDVRRGPFPVPRHACLPYLMGKAPRPSALSRDASKIRRANSEALLPRRGEQRRSRTLAASLAPAGQGGVAQRMPLQAAGPCSWACAVCSRCHPIRNATQRARPLLVGRARVSMGPKALEAGTAGGGLGAWAALLAPAGQGARRPQA